MKFDTNKCDYITASNYHCSQAAHIAYFSIEGDLVKMSAQRCTAESSPLMLQWRLKFATYAISNSELILLIVNGSHNEDEIAQP